MSAAWTAFGGVRVADFADHDDVGVLAQQRAHAVGKRESGLHLDLVEGGLDHFYRVLDGADIDFAARQRFQGAI